jgi:hypothetical protein
MPGRQLQQSERAGFYGWQNPPMQPHRAAPEMGEG